MWFYNSQSSYRPQPFHWNPISLFPPQNTQDKPNLNTSLARYYTLKIKQKTQLDKLNLTQEGIYVQEKGDWKNYFEDLIQEENYISHCGTPTVSGRNELL